MSKGACIAKIDTISSNITHIASNSRVSEMSKVVLTFFLMSETRRTAIDNVVFVVNGAS